jgi:hypothetical protein
MCVHTTCRPFARTCTLGFDRAVSVAEQPRSTDPRAAALPLQRSLVVEIHLGEARGRRRRFTGELQACSR